MTDTTLDNSVVFNADDELFDVVLMMDCSQCPIHPTLKDLGLPQRARDDAPACGNL